MYALVIEHAAGLAAAPPLAARWRHRAPVARLPGYRRPVEVFLFADPEDAATAQLGDAASELGLLVCAGDALSAPAALLRRSRATSAHGGQVCWRDRLSAAAPVTEQC
jgi:hypothetical protein